MFLLSLSLAFPLVPSAFSGPLRFQQACRNQKMPPPPLPQLPLLLLLLLPQLPLLPPLPQLLVPLLLLVPFLRLSSYAASQEPPNTASQEPPGNLPETS